MDNICEDVRARLRLAGYAPDSEDDASIEFSINRAAEYIRTSTNQREVPEGLYYVFIDMAAGMLLGDLKASGKLGEGFDFSAAVKRITEGDVTVEYERIGDGSSTPEARFDAMVDRMTRPKREVLAAFRKIKW